METNGAITPILCWNLASWHLANRFQNVKVYMNTNILFPMKGPYKELASHYIQIHKYRAI